MPRFSRGAILWLFGYLALMGVLVFLLIEARANVLAEMSTPEALAQWQSWKASEAERQKLPDTSARRRIPKSNEPPHLKLMRDHFPGILISLVVIVSAMYAFLALTLRGAWKQPSASAKASADRRAAGGTV